MKYPLGMNFPLQPIDAMLQTRLKLVNPYFLFLVEKSVYICPDDCEGYQIHNHVLDWVIFGGWDYVSAGSLCLIVKYRTHHPEHLIQESTE